MERARRTAAVRQRTLRDDVARMRSGASLMLEHSREMQSMSSLKERTCLLCESAYQPTGPAQKYCPPCGKKRSEECKERSARLSYENAVRTGRIKAPGVGTGGNQWEEKNSQWKGGISTPIAWRRGLKDSCERCESTAHLLVHHKNRNRKNNDPSNLETLCKSCHLCEHEVWKNYSAPVTGGGLWGAIRRIRQLIGAFEGGVASKPDLGSRLDWKTYAVTTYINRALQLGWVERLRSEDRPHPHRGGGRPPELFQRTASAPADDRPPRATQIMAVVRVFSSKASSGEGEERNVA